VVDIILESQTTFLEAVPHNCKPIHLRILFHLRRESSIPAAQ
jgi:hypothetical protein